jgi:pilus assembly protein CpaB
VRPRRLVRSPVAFWIIAFLLAVATAMIVSRAVSRAEATAARYGSPRPVVVATRDLMAGAVIGPGDIEMRRLPRALVPEGTLTTMPAGRTVVVPLFRGEPVLRTKVAPAGLRGVAALLPIGTRAVTVPAGPAPAPVRVGDIVDVLASFETDGSGEPTFAVAVEAVVVDVEEGTVTVAVRPSEVTRVVFAATAGVVSLVMRSQ